MRKGVLFASALLAGTVAMTIPAFASVGSWQRNGIGWWFEYSDGSYVQSSWIDINNNWYYFNPYTPKWTWELRNDGEWYYKNLENSRPLGSMYENEKTPDGYTVNANGERLQ